MSKLTSRDIHILIDSQSILKCVQKWFQERHTRTNDIFDYLRAQQAESLEYHIRKITGQTYE